MPLMRTIFRLDGPERGSSVEVADIDAREAVRRFPEEWGFKPQEAAKPRRKAGKADADGADDTTEKTEATDSTVSVVDVGTIDTKAIEPPAA